MDSRSAQGRGDHAKWGWTLPWRAWARRVPEFSVGRKLAHASTMGTQPSLLALSAGQNDIIMTLIRTTTGSATASS